MGEPMAVVTVLYPVAPVREVERRPESPSQPVDTGEPSLFQAGQVRVTRERLVVGARAWALRDVRQVETVRRTPKLWPYLLAVGLGGAVGLPLLSWLSVTVTAMQGAFEVGLALTALGLFSSMAALLLVEEKHYLVLGLPDGARRVFGSRDAQLIARLAGTVREARPRA
ncbi:hypothetical protein G4177_13070 [Corallococcus sp. ZKHCc1 1396]|uniref:Uncharacterized protein n=1 Tax=Corallococcus soli TaxID=2710757 RepID=A0ABR9PMJ9_9BACT|nr:DUF6232 family protein [Corallococcus soli]MBE4749094.1 hypothetical protein [Corallococcus soli]